MFSFVHIQLGKNHYNGSPVEEDTFQFYVRTVKKCFLYSLKYNEYPCIDGIDCVEISSSRENCVFFIKIV